MSDLITQEQIEARYAKFDAEDRFMSDFEPNNTDCEPGFIVREQLREEKKKNSELQKTVDSLSFILWTQYNKINDLHDQISNLKEFPNQGSEYPRVDPRSFHFQKGK